MLRLKAIAIHTDQDGSVVEENRQDDCDFNRSHTSGNSYADRGQDKKCVKRVAKRAPEANSSDDSSETEGKRQTMLHYGDNAGNETNGDDGVGEDENGGEFQVNLSVQKNGVAVETNLSQETYRDVFKGQVRETGVGSVEFSIAPGDSFAIRGVVVEFAVNAEDPGPDGDETWTISPRTTSFADAATETLTITSGEDSGPDACYSGHSIEFRIEVEE